MQATRHKTCKNTSFKPGELRRAFESIMAEIGISEAVARVSAEYRYGDDGNVKKDITFSDLELITDFSNNVTSVSLQFPSDINRQYDKNNFVSLSAFGGGILINTSSENTSTPDTILTILEGALKLIEMPKPEFKQNNDAELEARVEILEAKIQELSRQLSCFLSYRFNTKGKTIALELSRFLSLLDIKVVSGMGYEPRRITEKVTERLKLGHDFLIYLITKDGESMWTRDELVVSFSSGVPVIILVEKGSIFEKGLLGDWEYVEFDGDHIGDTFVSILEAIDFLKEQKIRNLVQAPWTPTV